jgi:alpha-L-arabinofuranosidase
VDADSYVWWNVGGWNNTASGIERITDGDTAEIGDKTPVTIDTGKWYDLKVELSGPSIKCYIDGKLITQATDEGYVPHPTLYATASREDASGQVILKVVNMMPTAQEIAINLEGVTSVNPGATGEEISGHPSDQNTIEEPEKCVPKPVKISDAGKSFVHEFPADSVSVIRIDAK